MAENDLSSWTSARQRAVQPSVSDESGPVLQPRAIPLGCPVYTREATAYYAKRPAGNSVSAVPCFPLTDPTLSGFGKRAIEKVALWAQLFGVSLSTSADSFCAQFGSGILLLRLMDSLTPGSVNWNVVKTPPADGSEMHIMKRIDNCAKFLALAVPLVPALKMVDPRHIADGSSKAVMLVLQELMRFHFNLNPFHAK